VVDVTCVDANEGLYAVFMDEEGIGRLVGALVWLAEAVEDMTPLPSTLNHLWMEMEMAQEWRERRVESLAQES